MAGKQQELSPELLEWDERDDGAGHQPRKGWLAGNFGKNAICHCSAEFF